MTSTAQGFASCGRQVVDVHLELQVETILTKCRHSVVLDQAAVLRRGLRDAAADLSGMLAPL